MLISSLRLLAAAAFLVSSAMASAQAVGIPDLSPDQWRADIRHLAEHLPRLHKNAFHFVSEARFRQAVAALDARLPAMTDEEAAVGVQELAAMIGDGHTYLRTRDLFRSLPIELTWFGDELRVVRAGRGYEFALGRRVLAIDGTKIGAARTRIRRLVPKAENRWFELDEEAMLLTRAEPLHALGISRQSDRVRFTLQAGREAPSDITLPALPPGNAIDWVDAVPGMLAAQHPEDGFWFTYRPASRAVYVNFRRYDDFEAKAKALFAFIDAHKPDKLIIDLRQNGGGNFSLAQRFLLYDLALRRDLNRKGHLFVLVGRHTFSAGMTNAIDFRRQTEAILVGEPIGARPNGYQENGWITLPHSKLRVSVSLLYYRFMDRDVPAALPDRMVPLRWTDHARGIDAALDWAERYPAADRFASRH